MIVINFLQTILDAWRAKSQASAEIGPKLDALINAVETLSKQVTTNTKETRKMANILDEELAENTAKIEAQTSVTNGLTLLLQDIVTKQQAALEKARAEGATPAQLAALTNNNDMLAANTQRIVDAMKLGTVAEGEPETPVVEPEPETDAQPDT